MVSIKSRCTVAIMFVAAAALPGIFRGQPHAGTVVHEFPDNEDWTFQQILGPEDGITSFDVPEGHTLQLNEFESFGFYETGEPALGVLPLTGNIMAVTWHLSSDAEEPQDVPDIRLRLTAKDGTYSQTYIIQDAFMDDDHASPIVPIEGRPLTFRTLTYVPSSVRNDNPEGSDGFSVAFDLYDFQATNEDRLGQSVVLEKVEVQEWKPNAFGGTPIVKLDQKLGDEEDQDAWTPSDPDIGGASVSQVADEDGLAVTTFGTPFDDNFYFGWWSMEDAFTVSPDSIYRVKWTVQVKNEDGDPEPSDSVVTRLRFQNETIDFVATAIPGARQTGDTSNNPTPDGHQNMAWIAIPDELAGEDIDVYFDVWQDESQPLPEGSTMVLKSLQIREEPAPDREEEE